MSSLAAVALKRLLERAENAYTKGESTRKVNLRFSEATFKQYQNASTWAEKDACHAALRIAEAKGAIRIEWNRRAGPGNQIDAIDLVSGNTLANHIDTVPRWRAVENAHTALLEEIERFPVLSDVLKAWSLGKRPKMTGAEDAADWKLAAKVIDYCQASGVIDVPIRRLSSALQLGSKRLEKMLPLLDALLQGDLQLEPREDEDILNEIGLIKFPPTMLIAGDVSVELSENTLPVTPPHPYFGLAPESIRSVVYRLNSQQLLLSVENLTTFHELARLGAAKHGAVLLYTGGMPSPSFKRAYLVFLSNLPPESQVFHWGDCDLGGFRIADHLAECCAASGKILRLHEMAPKLEPEAVVARRDLTPAEIRTIGVICNRRNWTSEFHLVEQIKSAIEQESLPICWPNRTI